MSASVSGILGNPLVSVQHQDPDIRAIDENITNTILQAEKVPGFSARAFQDIKEGVLNCWKELFQNGMIDKKGPDKEIRPYFVTLQGIIEHVLAHMHNRKEIGDLEGVIHTPMPPTPLCTEGEISQGLVDPSIEQNPQSLFTVQVRATIVRDYLHQGANLYCVYPREGFDKRSEAQQEIYRKVKEEYPTHLFDVPVDCGFEQELTGAYYLFRCGGKSFAFAIKMTQAKAPEPNDPQPTGDFGLWFGETNHPDVKDRITTVSNFIRVYSDRYIPSI
jgi:hypothetical protein